MSNPGCAFVVNGVTENPWTDMAQFIVDQMYPPFTTGYTARIAVLLVVLVVVILVSLLYITVTVRDMRRKGRSVWLTRLIRRPAGRYLAIHHQLCYPLFSIILAAVWISYSAYMHGMFGPSHGNPRHLFYYLTLGYLPLFALLSTTTFSTTSAANLASRGRQPNTHRLGPIASAAIFVTLVPVLLGIVIGTGIWTGSLWNTFASRWGEAHDFLVEQAEAYTGALDQAAVEKASELLLKRCLAVPVFQHAQHTTALIYVVVAAILIVLNVFAGLYLISTLRQTDENGGVVPRGTRVVAPLQPLASPSSGSEENYADLASTDAPVAAWEKDEQTKLKVHRLRWDVLLFFLSVVPSCLVFIAYESWMADRFIFIFSDAGLLEFALIGPIWIFSSLSLACLVALTVKTLLNSRRAKTWQPEQNAAAWRTPQMVHHKQQQPQDKSWMGEEDVDLAVQVEVPTRTSTPLGGGRR